MQQQLNSNNRVFDETANETCSCPSFSFGTPTKKKKQKRGEKCERGGRGPPPTCRLYLYLFFTFLSLSPSIPCHVGAAALGWGENCGGIIKWEETICNTQSSRQPATLYIHQLQPDKFPKVESSRHFISTFSYLDFSSIDDDGRKCCRGFLFLFEIVEITRVFFEERSSSASIDETIWETSPTVKTKRKSCRYVINQ